MKSAAKLLRFPLGGLAKNGSYRDTTYPTDESVYSTPTAMNVIGECALASRMRGGSRPGLKKVSGVVSANTGKWLWPNGEGILFGKTFSDWTTTINDPEYAYFVPPVYTNDGRWKLVVKDLRYHTSDEFYKIGTPEDTRVDFSALIYSTRTMLKEDNMIFSDTDTAALPDGSTLILQHAPKAIYRDRYVKCEGATWMASRTGDYGNFDFGGDADDHTRAVAGTLADAGQKGENITAIAAFGDQRIYIATRRRLAVIVGEPTSAVATLSTNVGIISADSWCNAEGTLFFMGQNGLYVVGEGAPICVSQQLPDDLKGLYSALLIYDPHYRGIHIFATTSGSVARDYFYDLDNKAFWPVSYPTAMRPVAGSYGVVDNVNRVVFRCTDGQYRYWDDAQTTDDGTAIASRVSIGPFKCGVNEGDGMLDEIDVTLANGSSSVNIDAKAGKTAESVATETVDDTRSFTASHGFNAALRPRLRGGWASLVITATGRWAYESIYARIKTLGRLRP